MTAKQEAPERVIFRKFHGSVIALFPRLLGTNDPATCLSYEHVGQHGSAHVQHVIQTSRPAAPSEYMALMTELHCLGYRLDVRKRATFADQNARRARQAGQVAARLYAAKPAADEGDLALAAWRRCVHAFAESGYIPPAYRAHFIQACEVGGWPI